MVIIKDIADNLSHNINTLTEENLYKILKNTTKEKLCTNPIIVRVDEIEKA